MTSDRNLVRKPREVAIGEFSTQEQYNCPRCGDSCVCVRLNLFPDISPGFATLYWRCERCTATKEGEQNGN